MRIAARAIIIEDDKVLVMKRSKQGAVYFTLVGGQLADGEGIEQALIREVMEETGLVVTGYRLVFIELHPEPYNEQYTFLCEVAPHQDIAIQAYSEEANLNKYEMNVHQPLWVTKNNFASLQFRTPQLHVAIINALKKGFPDTPQQL